MVQFWYDFHISDFRSCFRAPGKVVRWAIRTCRRMFRKGSPNPARLTFETVFGQPDAQNTCQESLTEPQEGPEWHRRAWMEHKIGPKPSPEDSQKTRNGSSIFSRENPLPRRKMSINTWGNIKFESTFFESCMCHINPRLSAPWRPGLPHVAQKHPQRPNKS